MYTYYVYMYFKVVLLYHVSFPAITRVGGNRKGVFTRSRQPKASAHHLRARYRALAAAAAGAPAPAPPYYIHALAPRDTASWNKDTLWRDVDTEPFWEGENANCWHRPNLLYDTTIYYVQLTKLVILQRSLYVRHLSHLRRESDELSIIFSSINRTIGRRDVLIDQRCLFTPPARSPSLSASLSQGQEPSKIKQSQRC